jgi:hypothetical protein
MYESFVARAAASSPHSRKAVRNGLLVNGQPLFVVGDPLVRVTTPKSTATQISQSGGTTTSHRRADASGMVGGGVLDDLATRLASETPSVTCAKQPYGRGWPSKQVGERWCCVMVVCQGTVAEGQGHVPYAPSRYQPLSSSHIRSYGL